MKKELTPRITLEHVGKRLIVRIRANRTFATLLLMPVIFILFVLVMANFLQEASTAAPLWWHLMLLLSIPLLGALFARQWLWEYRGFETLTFDLFDDSFTYQKTGSFWVGSDQTYKLSSLNDLIIKKRGFLEGNLRLALPPYCTLIGESGEIPIRMGDSIGSEDGWRVWMEIRKAGFLKDEQFHSALPLHDLK